MKARFYLAVGAIALCLGFLIIHRSPSDFPPHTAIGSVLITVSQGESGTQIAADLAKDGVIKSSATFIGVVNSDPAGRSIAPGVHKIATHIPAKIALVQMLDQALIQNVIVVKEGSTQSQIEKALRSDGQLVSHPLSGNYPLPIANPMHSLEGELAPAQYSFAPGTTTGAAISQMLAQAKSNFASTGILKGYDGYSSYQLLTIASLLQIEADPGDFAKAARVIYNRLKIGMALQLNSTVAYAAGITGQIGLSVAATHIDSAYNTYLHQGLPPTPISNPSLAAIKAVTNPATGNWLYFITVAPHDTRFTNSYSQFETWVTLYNHNVSIGLFK